MFRCMPFGKHIDYLDKRQCNLSQIPEDILRYARSVEELLLDSNHIRELSKVVSRIYYMLTILNKYTVLAVVPISQTEAFGA